MGPLRRPGSELNLTVYGGEPFGSSEHSHSGSIESKKHRTRCGFTFTVENIEQVKNLATP